MLDKAIALAATVFVGKFDKGGKPYILHCLHVMDAVKDLGTEAMIVGVLHDVIEDTAHDAESLLTIGFDERTVERVVMMTHLPNEPYMKYIKRVSIDKITRAVKKADLRHNSDIMRMKGLREKDFTRLEKYFKAYAYLEEAEKADAIKE